MTSKEPLARKSSCMSPIAFPAGWRGVTFTLGRRLPTSSRGSLVVEPDGKPPLTLKKGNSFHNPAKAVRNAKNGSTTEPAEVLVVLIGEKGAPLSTPVKSPVTAAGVKTLP